MVFSKTFGIGKFFSIASLLWLCHSCVVGPNYRAPKLMVDPDWNTASCDSAVEQTEEPLIDWWRGFNDPILQQLVEQAAQCNHDLTAAEWRIVSSRAARRAIAAAYFPQISGDINASRSAFSKNGPIAEFQPTINPSAASPIIQRPLFQNLFNINFDASWELDLFGNIYRNVEAAEAKVRSTMESRNDVMLTLLAEVARTYGELRGTQKQLELQREDVVLTEQLQRLRKERFQQGLDTGIDFEMIEANLATAQSRIPELEAQVEIAIYTLSVLVGEPPEALKALLDSIYALPSIPREIVIGLRSDLLRRRPDVRKAEEDLHFATAEIGIAISNFFPSFGLFGFFGLQSLMMSNLFEWQSNTWSYGGDLLFPVFQGGQLSANLRMKKADAQVAFQNYQQIVLRALQDAESSLVSFTKQGETTADLEKKVARIQTSLDLILQQWEGGLVNALESLNAKREWILSEQELNHAQTAQFVDLVALYKALGGGWQWSCCGECVSG